MVDDLSFEDILSYIETDVVAFMDHRGGRSRAVDVKKNNGCLVWLDNVNMEVKEFSSEEEFKDYFEDGSTSLLGVKEVEDSMFTEVDISEVSNESNVTRSSDGMNIFVDKVEEEIFIPFQVKDPVSNEEYNHEKTFKVEDNEELLVSVYNKSLDNYFRIIKYNEDRGLWKEETTKEPNCLGAEENIQEIN